MKKVKCKNCKKGIDEGEVISVPAGRFHDNNKCISEFIQKKKNKELDNKHKKIKRKFRLTDRKTRKKAAKLACHEYIRYRDRNKRCISCGGHKGKIYHAGHYLESGNNPLTRFDEENIHAQCIKCNMYKGGNLAEYRVNLIKKIGLDRVEVIESKKGGVDKLTCEDFIEIETYYKKKLNVLLNKDKI